MSQPESPPTIAPNGRRHMRRYTMRARKEWRKEVEKLGFDFHTDPNGYPYWNESNCYELTDEMVIELNKGINELHRMCIEVVAKAVQDDTMLQRLEIPAEYWPLIKESWKKREPTLYGRFDLMYDGTGPPKMLEYNADTPTTIMEASVIQLEWKKAMLPQCTQYNAIHERLIETWKSLNIEGEAHFASVSFSIEDYRTTMYILDTAHQAGINGRYIKIEDVGWDSTAKCFVNENKVPIANIFKLYPYEWMVREAFGQHLVEQKVTRFVEPAWKMILSNKGILPFLWEMFPNHPNLVPAYFTQHESLGDTFVKKPLYGREGENITFQCKGEAFWTKGLYGGEGYVYQQYCPLVDFSGRRPIVGGWVIGGKAAGIGIREDVSAITGNTSFFVPHIVREKEDANTPLPYPTSPCKIYQMEELMLEQSHLELPFCAVKVPRLCTIS